MALDRSRRAVAAGRCRIDQGVRVFMLKAAPGTRIPRHKHTGTEWTCVFEGAFRHDLGRYGPGDFDEADETVEHNPVVEDDEPCVCLVALQGSIDFRGSRQDHSAVHPHLIAAMRPASDTFQPIGSYLVVRQLVPTACRWNILMATVLQAGARRHRVNLMAATAASKLHARSRMRGRAPDARIIGRANPNCAGHGVLLRRLVAEREQAIYKFVGAALAQRGYVVVVPDYRVYPETLYPGFLEDGAFYDGSRITRRASARPK